MKPIIVHYITVDGNTTFNVKSKKVIVESLKSKNNFYDKCSFALNDFVNQCKLHEDSFYHMFCPTSENHSIHSDKVDFHPKQKKKLIEMYIFHFLEKRNFKEFIEDYKKMLKSLNGEEFFKEVDVWMKKNVEPYSHVREITYNYDI